MKVEFHALGLNRMLEKRGLTERQLAHDLVSARNDIPAIEGGGRKPGLKLKQQVMRSFACPFQDLFEVVLIDAESHREQVLEPKK